VNRMESDPKVPTVLESQPAVELSDMHASRKCEVCRGDADYYVFVTKGIVEEETDLEVGWDEWPLSKTLCRGCLSEAPTVDTIEELVEANNEDN